MSKPKKLGKDVLGKSKGAGVVRTKKEEYEKYKQKLAQDQIEQEKKEEKKKTVGSEKMEEHEPTAEQLAKAEAEVREDVARFKALKRGETVYVREHHRRRPASAKEETEGEEEEEEDEEE